MRFTLPANYHYTSTPRCIFPGISKSTLIGSNDVLTTVNDFRNGQFYRNKCLPAVTLIYIYAVRLKLVVTRFKKLEEKNRLLLFITHLRRQVLEVVHTIIQRKIKMLYDRTAIFHLIAECAKTRVAPCSTSEVLKFNLFLKSKDKRDDTVLAHIFKAVIGHTSEAREFNHRNKPLLLRPRANPREEVHIFSSPPIRNQHCS